ncbi:MAG: HAD family phosphatase [Pyrinomonadaceae bacterium]|nr:HAD family phosphatase [Phycisphaerales bacterium]
MSFPTNHKYSMLAIDLDGTLLCPAGKVSSGNLEALREARRRGIFVTICTGRGLIECQHVTSQIEQAGPVVVAGGSMVACPVTLRTLHRFPMDSRLVRELVNLLASHGHAVLILKDPREAGHDYVVVSERGALGIDPVTRWWFEQMNIPVRYVTSLDEDEHLPHTVRIGVCGPKRRTSGVADIVREQFHGRITMQHFQAVVPRPEDDDPEG